MMSHHDQARRVEFRIRRNDAAVATPEGNDSHRYTFLLGGRPQRSQARPEPSFAFRSTPQRSAATIHHLNHVNIGSTPFRDAHGISHGTFGCRRTVNRYDDE